ncbi:hypothetical protein BO78DRAFT_318636 [Aspergillus sclerotiicarbonarius CBS 121057]|uniref:Uncharacterized protein n=1 Tax=Aspergillus sclerotiicarbonarius (strain CBS 121057 / IBT 28362) TaxID=1448318 RepID=A0A319E560_ASPSB|nr:hypothetical protein BO78DRAFT_318636 [Aspergillus sclerotiicarbonarius CBS 121057]
MSGPSTPKADSPPPEFYKDRPKRGIIHPTYRIAHVWFNIPSGAEDPHVHAPQYRHGLWVEKEAAGAGDLHHVIGSISQVEGMRYEIRPFDRNITNEPSFSKQSTIGYLSLSCYENLKEEFAECATPSQQKDWNESTNTTEPIDYGVQPPLFYTSSQLKNFQFPTLTTDRDFVERQLLPRVWDFAVSFDEYEDQLNGFFPVADWVPLGGGPLKFYPVVQWKPVGY